MKIREATLADAKAIADIHTDSWRNTYQNALRKEYLLNTVPQERKQLWIDRLTNPKPNQYVAVAEVAGEIAGFVCIYFEENPRWGAYLDNLHVLREFQSKGMGKALLIQAAERVSQQDNVTGMCLLVNQDNTNAQAFYLRLGAKNAEAAVWNAPDGSAVPTYWFVWGSLTQLIACARP